MAKQDNNAAGGKEFARRLRQEHSKITSLQDIFQVENELGAGSVGFMLDGAGKTLLFRTLDAECNDKSHALGTKS